MAILHRLRDRGRRLSPGLDTGRRRRAPSVAGVVAGLAMVGVSVVSGCAGDADLSLRPDSLLRAELGLTDDDRVHRVSITGGAEEILSPSTVELEPGSWVEFVTLDWRVHEVRFEADSLGAEARAFLESTDQMASPPLVNQDDRFLVSFRGAPEARYPFVVVGNGAPSRGVVVVGSRR